MNGNVDLPDEHFWDSEAAEQEYHAVERGIAEAEEKLKQTQGPLSIAQGIFNRFNASVSGVKDFNSLNHALNPYWIGPDGKRMFAPRQGSLTLLKVESETVRITVNYGRYRKWSGAYVNCKIEDTYLKWVGWYTLSGEVAMSGLEQALWYSGRPYTTPGLLSDKLWKELVQEVSMFIAPLKEQVVLKFYPYLAPTNTREICMSNGVYKKDVPKLAWPPMAAARLPLVGGRYGFNSYGKICWMCCGRWETYKFPTIQLEACWELIERITKRLHDRIIVTSKEVVRIEEEIRLLRRRLDKIRILHYKPVVYKEFWSALQTTQSGRMLINAKQAKKV